MVALMVLALVGSACASASNPRWKLSQQARSDQSMQNRDVWSPDDIDLASHEWSDGERLEGSLWQNTYNARLYDNMYRASKIGDTVVIVVSEQTSALNQAKTKADKKTEHKGSIDNLGGLMSKLSGLLTGLNPAKLIGAKTESKFQGDGSTERKGQLQATLSGRIMRIMPNGNMALRAEQHMKINEEEQVLVVEGTIRPYDILPNNTVLSSSIADARISYRGFGVVAERQRPGWLIRMLDYVWPF